MVKKESSNADWPPARGAKGGDGFSEALLRTNPLTAGFAGGLDFMKNLWGGLPSTLPGFVVPTVDLEELDKRLTDLKAVESWLALNANMLRTTIQSLEVQRNTIAALQSFGGSLSQSTDKIWQGMGPSTTGATPKEGASSAASASAASSTAAPANEPPKAASPSGAKTPTTAKAKPASAKGTGTSASSSNAALAGAAWLDFLQNQFNQVASAALSGAGPNPKGSQSAGAKTAARAPAKGAPKVASKGGPKGASKAPRSKPKSL